MRLVQAQPTMSETAFVVSAVSACRNGDQHTVNPASDPVIRAYVAFQGANIASKTSSAIAGSS